MNELRRPQFHLRRPAPPRDERATPLRKLRQTATANLAGSKCAAWGEARLAAMAAVTRQRRSDSIVHEPYLGYSLSRQSLLRPANRHHPTAKRGAGSGGGRGGQNIDRKTPLT